MVKEAQSRIDSAMTDHQLDAIAFFDNKEVILPAVAGYPEITVPVGATEKGIPLGATFMSRKDADQKLTEIAYSFEQQTKSRLVPEKYLGQ